MKLDDLTEDEKEFLALFKKMTDEEQVAFVDRVGKELGNDFRRKVLLVDPGEQDNRRAGD